MSIIGGMLPTSPAAIDVSCVCRQEAGLLTIVVRIEHQVSNVAENYMQLSNWCSKPMPTSARFITSINKAQRQNTYNMRLL
jgi:hypothetical protein